MTRDERHVLGEHREREDLTARRQEELTVGKQRVETGGVSLETSAKALPGSPARVRGRP